MAIQFFNRKNLNYRFDSSKLTLLRFIDYTKEINLILLNSLNPIQVNISISNDEMGFVGNINDLENERQSLRNKDFNFFSCNFYSSNNPNQQKNLSLSLQKNVSNLILSSNNLEDNVFNSVVSLTRKYFDEIISINQRGSNSIDLENLDLKLKTIQTEWDKIDFQKFYKTDLGVENIETLKPLVDDIYSKLNEVINFGSASIPKPSLYNLYNSINNFYIQVKKVSELNNEDFITQKSNLIQNLKNSYESILLHWAQIAAIISLNIQEENKSSVKQIDNIKKEIAETKVFINSIKSDYETSLLDFQAKFKSELENSQLINEKNTFEQRAIKHKNNSLRWLISSMMIFLFLIIILCLFFFNPMYEVSKIDFDLVLKFNSKDLNFSKNIIWFQLIKTFFFKILIISMLIYVLTFSIKNYNVEKHNFVINTNKVNSIQSALHFLNNNLTDLNSKNEIIRLVCQSIFSQHNTGFINKESEPSNPIMIDRFLEKTPIS